MTIYLKNEEEIELIRESAVLVCLAIAEVAAILKPGVTGLQLDALAEEFIRDHQGEPAFKGYNDYPATLCISRNEVVVHGIPNDDEFKPGDIISIDCGVKKHQFFGDSAYTFVLGEAREDIQKLLRVTNESLYLGIKEAIDGNRLGDISAAIQYHAEQLNNYGVVRDLVGHGIGKELHEAPEVPNFGKKGKGIMLKEGMTLALEPMINLGTKNVRQLNDGWTVITADKKPSAHYEHTIVVRKTEAQVLSDHFIIEKVVKNNIELAKIH
ncbi:MAG: type I methionyl aminopeptidase [Bacteroidota bacterium]|nr:type I methionyl aminopeptidase [Bacteroidota bacterium]